MKTQKNTLAIVLGGAFAASLVAVPVVHAEQNPFAMKTLPGGYMVADADQAKDGEKMKDGKCGTGKCGATKKKAMKEKAEAEAVMPSGEEKSKDGKCSGDKKSAEGKCSGNKH